MKARRLAKRFIGGLIERAGRVTYDNCIFILAHMRCGSTALSNIICSRPDVNGYGEAHIRYSVPGALGRLALNHVVRDGWSRQAPYMFDKVLHSRLDTGAPPEFFTSRAIFVLREPEPTIRSICNLYEKIGRAEFRSKEAAAHYYVARVEALAGLWDRFPADRRIGMTHKGLMHDPERALAAISHHLGFAPPLANRYESRAASRKGGGGDPLVSGRHERIEPALLRPSRPVETLSIPAELAHAAEARFDELRTRIAASWPDLAL